MCTRTASGSAFACEGKSKTATWLPFLVFSPSPVGEDWGEGTRQQKP